MSNNQAKRDLAMQFVRYRSAQFEGLYVNRAHCPQLDKSEELQHLLKKGLVVRVRVIRHSMTSNTALRPADGITQAQMPVCKLCKGSIPYLLGGQGHKANCAGVIERLNPNAPTYGQLVERRKSARKQRQKAIEFRKAVLASGRAAQ